MRLRTYLLSLLALTLTLNSTAQTKSQNVIAAAIKQGKYKRFKNNGHGIFLPDGTRDISVQVNSKNLATSIKIGNGDYDVWSKSDSDWSSGFDLNNDNCLWIPDDGESIVLYELDVKSNTVAKIKVYYGKKTGKHKAVTKLINTYLAAGVQEMQNDKDAVAQVKIDHRNKYSIANKEVTDLKIELISDDKTIDCGSTFQVGIIATTAEGSVIKSHNLGGEFYSSDFNVRVHGAMRKSIKIADDKNDDKYTVKPFCEDFRDNTLSIKVTANGKINKTEKLEIKVNCTPDPAVAAAKIEAEQRKKERAAFLAAEKKRKAEEAKNPKPKPETTATSTTSSTSKNNQASGGKVTRMRINPSFMYMPNLQMEVMGGYMGKDAYTFVGGLKYVKENTAAKIVSYKNIELGMKSMNTGARSGRFTGYHTYAVDETKDGKFIVGAKNSILFLDEKFDVIKAHNDPGTFVAVQDLGNGKCAALQSTNDYNSTMNHVASRTGLSLVIWDYTSGKSTTIALSTEEVSAKPQLVKTSDGNVVIAYDEFSHAKFSKLEKGYFMTFTFAETKIYKVDPAKSLSQKKLSTIWAYQPKEFNYAEITDLIEARNGDIVFVGKTKVKRHEASGNNRNFSSFIHMGSLKANGTNFTHSEYDYLGKNKHTGFYNTPKHSKYIYMGALGRPLLLENPKGSGYLVAHRPSTDVLRHNNDKEDELFQDVPALIMHNAKTLTPETMTSLDVFYKTPEKRTYRQYSTDPFTGEKFEIKDFQYHPAADKFIFVEERLSTNSEAEKASRRQGYQDKIGEISIWVVDVVFSEMDHPGEDVAADVEVVVASNSGGSSNNNGSSSSVSSSDSSDDDKPKFNGDSFTVTHNYKPNSDPNDPKNTIYIHYGANNVFIKKIKRPYSATVPCEEASKSVLSYSYTGKKNDMIPIKQTSVDDCRTKIKSSSFMK